MARRAFNSLNAAALLLCASMAFSAEPPATRRVACVGDNTTFGAAFRDPGSYPAELARILGEKWTVKNFCVSGATLLKKGYRPYWNQREYKAALEFKPDVVLIRLGTNDSTPQNWRHKAEFVSDYVELIESFRKLESNPRVWICYPVPPYPGEWNLFAKIIKEEVIPRIDEVARKADVKVIDLYLALSNKKVLLPGSIDPNTSASRVIAETIAAKIKGDMTVKRVLWSDIPLVLDDRVAKSMRYSKAAWERAVYPLGNGRLGCTVFGEPRKERIQFNEDSLWVGNEDCTGGYQPFGDLYIETPHNEYSDYRRELDISRAVQTVTYKSGGVNYRREYFSSHPAQVMVFRFSADRAASLSGIVSMGNLHEIPITADNGTLTMMGDTGNFWWWRLQVEQPRRLLGSREYASDKNIDLDFEAQVSVLNEGGTVKTVDDKVVFENCDSVTILLAADTNYLNQRSKGWRTDHPHERVSAQIAAAEKRSYAELLDEHVADYQGLYGRFSIDLGDTPAETAALSTLERAKAYSAQKKKEGVSVDRDLEELLYQYARYLMISCSRPGEGALPANLQGLWLYNRRPAWRCDYHTDINLQMNYWFTGPANLAECFVPVAEWVDSIRDVRKEETRKVLKIRRGWLMRSENNIFGGSTYHFQKGDSAWICQNLWDHYAFTQDKEYLTRYAYPVMKEISQFWVDHLKELPDGTLVAPDGRSPEHGPKKADGVSYDQQLCWDLFTNVIEASVALGVDAEYREELTAKREKLLGPKIGKWGQLQEWMEDIDDPKDNHRHTSHMIAVHPGRQIHPTTTPEFAEAAKVGLMARGNGRTGWSKVWKICIFARLLDSERAYEMLSDMMATKLLGNLWTTHPPFQIDCNFGYAAGVNEMLVQSHMGYIHLLPALPKVWPAGSVRGFRVRGGYELDLEWKDGALSEAVLRGVSNGPGKAEVRYGKGTATFALARGESRVLHADDFGQEE